MLKEQRFNAVSKLALLFVLCGAGIVVSSIITALIGNIMLNIPLENLADALLQPENVQVSRLLQVFTSFLIMALPALMLAKITAGEPIHALGFREQVSLKQIGIVAMMVVTGFFLGGALSELNQMIPVTDSAEALFKKMEDNYNNNVMAIGNMKSVSDYILALMVMAVVPAIFEEMLFRGSLQQIMVSLTRNAFAGILIASVIFSAIHGSFYGFLPMLFLGLLLGYIFYDSKNLWLSVIAHFLNNAYTLTIMYSLNRQGKLSVEAFEETYPLYYGLISAAVIIVLFILLRKETPKLLLTKGTATN